MNTAKYGNAFGICNAIPKKIYDNVIARFGCVQKKKPGDAGLKHK